MMKKSLWGWLVISFVCLSLIVPCFDKKVHAMTVLETDVITASDGCTMLGVYGTYYSQAQDALDRINEIRKEACEDGNVPDPRNSGRMLTPGDYVPIKWSTDLESVARIRAMEGGLAYSFMGSGHNRLNGKNWYSLTYNGVSSYAEDLAYNWGTSMVSGIDQWYREKSDWVNQVSGAVTGHYTSMINPNFTYVGLGDFYTEEAVYPNTLAGEFCSSSQELDQTMQDALTDVMQKIEVQTSYITGYTLDGIDTIYTDGTTTLTPRVNLQNGSNTHKLWILDSVTYTSSDTCVATVTDAGVVTGVKNGTATITAKSGNNPLATVVITVKCNHAKELVSETPSTCIATGLKVYTCDFCGESVEQEVPKMPHDYIYGEADSEGYRTGICSVCEDTVKIIPPTTYTLWWRNSTSDSMYYWNSFPSSNPIGSTIYCWLAGVDGDSGYRDMVIESTDESVISVSETAVANSSNNQLKVLAPGITTITIYPKYNANLKKSVVARIGDSGSVDITAADVTLSLSSFEYSGKECTPAVNVSYHDTTLQKGTDYSVTYENNIETGTATVVIAGNGIFAGTIRKDFTIQHTEHVYSEWNITTAASCIRQGENRRDCTLCDQYETETIGMLDHEIVTDDAVPANCTESGLTEGSHCSVCESIIAAQEVIEGFGHNYVDGQCRNCNDIIYINISGLKYTILYEDEGLNVVNVTAPEGVTLTGEVNIPAMIEINGEKYTVTTVGKSAFAGQNDIESITIPSTITEIESKAFSQCSNLENITFLGMTAPVVTDDLFDGTSSVELIVPSKATGYDALAETTGVTLKPDHVHRMVYQEAVDAGCVSAGNIAYYVCDGCANLYSDEFGNSQITLEDTIIGATGHSWDVFYTIDVPATAATNGSKSIHCGRCSATKEKTVIPATGDSGDEDLTEDKNSGNTEDNPAEDKNDDNMKDGEQGNVDNPVDDERQYRKVGETFKVNGITYKVVKSNSNKKQFEVSCIKTSSKKISKFKMPAKVSYNDVNYKVVSVGKNAFAGCKKLKTLSLGSNVTRIDDKAFYNCSALTKITIPSKVTKIGKQAFDGCKKVKTITIHSKNLKESKIGKNAFKGIKSKAMLEVPKKKYAAYKKMLQKKGVSSKATFKKI